jgi:uncharacterized protein (TIGR02996 family)
MSFSAVLALGFTARLTDMSELPTCGVDGRQGPLFDIEAEWARRAVADINASKARASWCELTIHAHQSASRSKPTKRWRGEADRLIDEIGTDEVGAHVSAWLMHISSQISRERLATFEETEGSLLRGLIWAATGLPSLSPAALGQAARECLTKVSGLRGPFSPRVAHAAIAALAESATDDAIAELLAIKWSTTYSKSRELLEGALAQLAAQAGCAVAELEALGRAPTEPDAPALDVAAALTACQADLEAGRQEDALEGLLAVWRATKSQRVADALAVLGPRLASAIDETTEAGTSERFSELATRGRAADVDALTAHFPTSSSTRNLERSLELASLAPDPRVAAALARDVAHSPYDGCSRVVLNALVRIADPSTIATVSAKAPDCAAAIQARCRDAIALDSHDQQRVERIAAALGAAPAIDDLLAAIYAEPDRDEARAVCADVLSEAGDPRGEFIALQLAGDVDGESRRRVKELERQHGDEWVGVLGAAVIKSSISFRRGFVAAASLHKDPRRAAKITARPEWATIEDLDLRQSSYYGTILPPTFFFADCMRQLRVVRGLFFEQLLAILRHDGVLGLERIEATMDTADYERGSVSELTAADSCTSLPRLRDLAIVGLRGIKALRKTQLGRRVEVGSPATS